VYKRIGSRNGIENTNITAIVLAGGKSTRIGTSKSSLKIGESRLIDRVLDTLSQFTSSAIIVTNEDQPDPTKTHRLNSRVFPDIYPGKGPLGGIYTGLSYSESTYNLVVGCDMPFLNSDLIQYLINCAHGADIVAPKIGKWIEPLHAIYSKNCLPTIEALIQDGQLQIIRLFDLVNTRYVTENEIAKFDPDHKSFMNVNTEGDLMKVQALIGQAAEQRT
jgi:molybdenum cofactor guanylyltransferase